MKLLPLLIAGAFGRKKGSSRTENEGIAKLESTINALDNDRNDLFKDQRFKKDNFQIIDSDKLALEVPLEVYLG